MWIDDDVLIQCAKPCALSVWIPESPLVVLGNGNDRDRECHVRACKDAGVPILRRYGGGGAVVLYPGAVVLSFGTWVRDLYENKKYFHHLNDALIGALAKEWPELDGLSQKGISDIAWGDRKIVGTSLFRSRNYLLYQASILVEPGVEFFETYLQHPSKEPEYRSGKSHGEFVGSLQGLDPAISPDRVKEVLQDGFDQEIGVRLLHEFVDPISTQMGALLARVTGEPAAQFPQTPSC